MLLPQSFQGAQEMLQTEVHILFSDPKSTQLIQKPNLDLTSLKRRLLVHGKVDIHSFNLTSPPAPDSFLDRFTG